MASNRKEEVARKLEFLSRGGADRGEAAEAKPRRKPPRKRPPRRGEGEGEGARDATDPDGGRGTAIDARRDPGRGGCLRLRLRLGGGEEGFGERGLSEEAVLVRVHRLVPWTRWSPSSWKRASAARSAASRRPRGRVEPRRRAQGADAARARRADLYGKRLRQVQAQLERPTATLRSPPRSPPRRRRGRQRHRGAREQELVEEEETERHARRASSSRTTAEIGEEIRARPSLSSPSPIPAARRPVRDDRGGGGGGGDVEKRVVPRNYDRSLRPRERRVNKISRVRKDLEEADETTGGSSTSSTRITTGASPSRSSNASGACSRRPWTRTTRGSSSGSSRIRGRARRADRRRRTHQGGRGTSAEFVDRDADADEDDDDGRVPPGRKARGKRRDKPPGRRTESGEKLSA